MELDIYVPRLGVAIEPGSWYWHQNGVERDREKRELCGKSDIRLITIYDDYTPEERPFEKDCLVYETSLGQERNRKALRELTLCLMRSMGTNHKFTEPEWRSVARAANEASRLNDASFRERMSVVHPELEVLGRYEGYREKVEMRCEEGHEFAAAPMDLLNGCGCGRCAIERNAKRRMLIQEQFVAKVREKSPTVQVLSEYKGQKERVWLRCESCGREWEVQAASILRREHKCKL